jgi:hypothetical protein
MAKLFRYDVPLTQPLLEFLAEVRKVKGKLTGGFQSLAEELLERVSGGRLYLDDAIMGRAYRYARTYVAGGWQDTHLPKFIHEVEHLLRTKEHRKSPSVPSQGGLYGP